MSEEMERFRCFACGKWTDEVTDGPSPDAEHVNQASRWNTGVLDVHVDGCDRCCAAVACWTCFWKTEPDMWILAEHWDALSPMVPSGKLPVMVNPGTGDSFDPKLYPWPLVEASR